MLIRVISGIIALAILVALLLLPPYVLAILVLAVSIIGLIEFSNAMKHKDIHVDLVSSIIAAIAIVGRAYGVTLPKELFPHLSRIFSRVFASEYLNAIVYLAIAYFFCKVIFEKGRFKLEDMAFTMLGIVYIPFLMSFAVSVRNLDRGFEYVWLIVIGSIVTDTFAYFTGVTMGKTKIIPHISPKKTVEGSIGGAIGCMLTMILYGKIIMNQPGIEPIPIYHLAILGILCGVVSQLGDWAASAIKRDTGIKDFGKLIPGHGGIMDRIDSIIFISPLVYIYVCIFLW
ncbi:MAG TPA: phosphatidate cytidylyltransferase [Ruminiclostridium sp.]|nr:phosphatidate cytidylyltransferase [Ruminiclostridium sp.]